jgi:hypothetical protein
LYCHQGFIVVGLGRLISLIGFIIVGLGRLVSLIGFGVVGFVTDGFRICCGLIL